EGHGCSVPGDTFAFQKSNDKRELPRANVHTVSIGGIKFGVERLRSDYMCHAGDRRPTEDRQIQTTPVGTAAPVIRQISVTRVDERGRVHTDPLITASLDESFYPHGICAE
nr:hypothetical protein [Tanacetum cinerariifolium]